MEYYYVFNIIINSLLSFFTVFLFVSFGLFALRIKHPRIKSICYALPFIKPFMDIFLYDFSSWALPLGLDPNLAEKGTRFLSALVGPYPRVRLQLSVGELDTGWTYSLADVCALKMDPLVLKGICFGVVGISVVRLVLFLLRWSRERRFLLSLLERATLNHSFLGPFFLSSEVSGPCVVLGKVVFPDTPGVSITGNMLNDLLTLTLYYNGEFKGNYSDHSYGGEIRFGF